MVTSKTTSKKSPVRCSLYENLQFQPRFEYGHMAEVTEICGHADGSELSSGFVKLKKAEIPWTTRYDEVLIVLEGELQVDVNNETHRLSRYDSLWLPAGSKLTYKADYALVSYAIHPANWSAT